MLFNRLFKSRHEDTAQELAPVKPTPKKIVPHAAPNKKTMDAFLSTLEKKDQGAVNRYKQLHATGKRFKGLAERAVMAKEEANDGTIRSFALDKRGMNKAFKLTEETKNSGKESYYNKYHSVNKENAAEEKLGMYKEVYMPLIANGLGIDNLLHSSRADVSSKEYNNGFDGQTSRMKGTMNKISEQTTDLSKASKENIAAIDPQQVQNLMLMDLLFENQDAHHKQYLVDQHGKLSKIDNEGYMQDEIDAHGFGFAKAGSFMAGLPQANREITDETANLVESWDPQFLAEMLENATFGVHNDMGQKEKNHIFTEEQRKKVMSNMTDLKQLIGEAKKSGLSAREVFDRYNSRDQDGNMTGQSITRPPNASPALFNNHYGTRLSGKDDVSKYDELEAQEANALAERRKERQQYSQAASSYHQNARSRRQQRHIRPSELQDTLFK